MNCDQISKFDESERGEERGGGEKALFELFSVSQLAKVGTMNGCQRVVIGEETNRRRRRAGTMEGAH